MSAKDKCAICGKYFELDQLYEYRGAIACEKHHDQLCEKRDFQRAEIIEESNHNTRPFKGLNTGNDSIGKANREILKTEIDIAKKESERLKRYERGEYMSAKDVIVEVLADLIDWGNAMDQISPLVPAGEMPKETVIASGIVERDSTTCRTLKDFVCNIDGSINLPKENLKGKKVQIIIREVSD